MIHVPFKGSPDAMQDVIGGRVAFYMAPINAALGLVKEGKLAALGVSTKARADVLPEVPRSPSRACRLRRYALVRHVGAGGHAAAVVQKLNAAVERHRADAEVMEQFGKLGISPRR